MDGFARSLQEHFLNLRTYFVGGNPFGEGQTDYSEMSLMMREKGAGPHCLTPELD